MPKKAAEASMWQDTNPQKICGCRNPKNFL